jgi:hypothetical protein
VSTFGKACAHKSKRINIHSNSTENEIGIYCRSCMETVGHLCFAYPLTKGLCHKKKMVNHGRSCK